MGSELDPEPNTNDNVNDNDHNQPPFRKRLSVKIGTTCKNVGHQTGDVGKNIGKGIGWVLWCTLQVLAECPELIVIGIAAAVN